MEYTITILFVRLYCLLVLPVRKLVRPEVLPWTVTVSPYKVLLLLYIILFKSLK